MYQGHTFLQVTVTFQLLNAIKMKTYYFSKASLLTLIFSVSRLETVLSYAPMTLQEIGRYSHSSMEKQLSPMANANGMVFNSYLKKNCVEIVNH